MAKKEDKSASFEAQLKELEEIIDRLESGAVELEPSLALFERGVALYKELKGRMQKAEARVEKLIYELDGASRRVGVKTDAAETAGDEAAHEEDDADEDGPGD